MLPRVARFSPAADDEFLLVMELQLSPRRAAPPRLVGRRRVLYDQAFPSLLLRARVKRAAVAGGLLADSDRLRLRSRQQPLEPRPTLDERQPAQIVLAFAQQIERDERHRLFAVDPRDVAGVAQVNPALQPLKSHWPPVAIEGDDLAIDDERFARGGAKRRERFDDGRKLRRLVVAEP